MSLHLRKDLHFHAGRFHRASETNEIVVKIIAALVVAGFPNYINDMAVWLAPGKTPSANLSEKSKEANAKFWDAFHGGHYEELPQVLDALTAAYVENPRDAQTAAHIGFSHVWRLSEHARLDTQSATITDETVLARKYFSEAVLLANGGNGDCFGRLAGFGERV
jgi:hypothetical protein